MDTLYGAGVTGKLYRLWFMINKDTQIRVKTSFGMTQTAVTGENVAQGWIGGGVISSLNLDKTVTAHFGGSDTALSYGPSRLSPLLQKGGTPANPPFTLLPFFDKPSYENETA